MYLYLFYSKKITSYLLKIESILKGILMIKNNSQRKLMLLIIVVLLTLIPSCSITSIGRIIRYTGESLSEQSAEKAYTATKTTYIENLSKVKTTDSLSEINPIDISQPKQLLYFNLYNSLNNINLDELHYYISCKSIYSDVPSIPQGMNNSDEEILYLIKKIRWNSSGFEIIDKEKSTDVGTIYYITHTNGMDVFFYEYFPIYGFYFLQAKCWLF